MSADSRLVSVKVEMQKPHVHSDELSAFLILQALFKHILWLLCCPVTALVIILGARKTSAQDSFWLILLLGLGAT